MHNNQHLSFIRDHPEFSFNIEEYLHSTKYTNPLVKRFTYFQKYLETNTEVKYKERIVSELQNNISKKVPAYKKFSSIKEFSNIPFISKESLRCNLRNFINNKIDLNEVWHKYTSGTTGTPVRISYSPIFYFEFLFLSIPKICTRAKILITKDRPIFCLGITDNRSLVDSVTIDPTGIGGLMMQVVIDEARPETIERLFRLIKLLKPAIIRSKPVIFEMLAYHALNYAIDDYTPDCIISSGSFLNEKLRKRIQKQFRSEVVNAYGLTEFGLVASECPKKNGLHIDQTSIFAELRENVQTAKNSREGELVLSGINNIVMPLVRYCTWDIASVDFASCSCGISGIRLKKLLGRNVSCFRFESGALFSPAHFNELFYLFPISEFQITQTSLKHFEVLIEPKTASSNINYIDNDIQRYIENMLPSEVSVSVKTTKFKYKKKFERYRTLI